MKTTVRLTLDGLVRALRVKAHALADDAEQVYLRDRRMEADGAADAPPRPELSMELAR
jgi:hypothetical protein